MLKFKIGNIKEPLELFELEKGKYYYGTNWHTGGEVITPVTTSDGNSETNTYYVFGVGLLSYEEANEPRSLFTEVDIRVEVLPLDSIEKENE